MAPPQFLGVRAFELFHQARHVANGIPAELRATTVGGSTAGFELEPEVAFVGGDHAQPGGFPHNRQVGLQTAAGQGP